MKSGAFFKISIISLVFIIASCNAIEKEVLPQNTTSDSSSSVHSPFRESNILTTSTPIIADIKGDMKDGWIISDINKSRKITITGKNFGNFGGAISVPMSYGDPRLNDYHYGFDIISWTDSKIEAKVFPIKGITKPLSNIKIQILYPNEQPFPYFYLTIHKYVDATKAIKSDTKYNLGVPLILPYINGIPYNTPLWYLNGRRYDLVKKFLPTNTTNLQNVKIDELYHPQAGDIWTFPKGDMKIIEEVKTSQSFGTIYISVITSIHDSSPKDYTTNSPRNYAYDGYKRETHSNLISIYAGKRSIKQLAKLNLKIYR